MELFKPFGMELPISTALAMPSPGLKKIDIDYESLKIAPLDSAVWYRANYEILKDMASKIPVAEKGARMTVEKLKTQGERIHTYQYDYSLIPDNQTIYCHTEITTWCRLCGYKEKKGANGHLLSTAECPGCSMVSKPTGMNYELLLVWLRKIHGTRYFLDLIKEEHVTTIRNSRIPIICNICGLCKEVSLINFLYKYKGCPGCGEIDIVDPTNQFVEIMGLRLHRGMYNYKYINPYEIVKIAGNNFNITCLKCNTHKSYWAPTYLNHVYDKCMDCNRWTGERFLTQVYPKGCDKFDYSQVDPSKILNSTSAITVVHKLCNSVINTQVKYHWDAISQCKPDYIDFAGCNNCGRQAWDWERIIAEFQQKYNNVITCIVPEPRPYINGRSVVTLKCSICSNTWSGVVRNALYFTCRCKFCNMSAGELMCFNALKELGITPTLQFPVKINGTNKFFDFKFDHKATAHVIEFDGDQHFVMVPFFHVTDENFEYRRKVDIQKTQFAVENGYKILRIDHTKIKYIKEWINYRLNVNDPVVYTDTKMYDWIINGLGKKIEITEEDEEDD